MANSPLLAGLELGGTKCVAILGTGPDDVRARDTVPPTDPATTLAALEQELAGWQFDALGLAPFGPPYRSPTGSSPGRDSAFQVGLYTLVAVSLKKKTKHKTP